MCLLIKIDRFLRDTSMTRSEFGRRVANDPRLVSDMLRGRVVGPVMVERIERLLAERAG